MALWRVAPWLAPGVVVAVVDPGVGTDRRPIAVETQWPAGRLVLIGPDNGLLFPAIFAPAPAAVPTPAASALPRAVRLDNPAYQLSRRPGSGTTFDGRDVFAPAGAHAWLGVDIDDLGSPIDPASLAGEAPRVPRRVEARGRVTVEAEVLWVDRYGNAQLNAASSVLQGLGPAVEVATPGARFLAFSGSSYAGISTVGLIVDSYGMVSLCLERSSAAERFGLEAGQPVSLTAPAEPVPLR